MLGHIQELDVMRYQQDEARKKAEKAGQMEVLKVHTLCLPICLLPDVAASTCIAMCDCDLTLSLQQADSYSELAQPRCRSGRAARMF